MIRVHVICEGQTEEMFINEVLAQAFHHLGIYLMPALIGKPGHKGGNFRFERLLSDVEKRLLGDRQAYCTTFFDFYGLPEEFPGKANAAGKNSMDEKADCLLEAMVERLAIELGDDAMRRFIPYVQMYEFEGLLFSCPRRLATGINQPNLEDRFMHIRNEFETPETINNSPMTAPSKRLKTLYAGYDKPLHGSLAAIEIGLPAIREQCSRFDTWLSEMEALQPVA
ncbi:MULTISPECIES: DUF4276 family protein [Pseudomonas]|jgi:hypothetical protein|uniref:Uncharacterized protein n=2 Tax=Pseudomonas TaxID=286 RepID=A0ACA7PD85_9PSED|nr:MULTISPECIES: DUF4276 family protein [Pseudomonas]AHC37754.1 hypothetical protein U771_26380 [Pseudomonas sp. TKP]MBL1311506.1 DUF4276 family protein [Pseudomonas sp.]PMX17457.1 DUF4276 domain-containing protein [Pseudomonas sp. MPBC4-3]PMX27193.1 DUF4276 domain-containing protein [Pseudomonas sp. GW460-12]PMX35213.1 DUF4276 domain-containing protein [Pseudomonas sp. MPR-R2A4]